MKKILIVLSLFCTLGFSHNLIMEVLDNEDNTLTIVGAYNTGDKAAGAMIRLESLITGKILYKQRLPYESELTMAIPSEAYQIVLDGGPDHIIIEKGISPKEGFAIYFSFKNTEKIVNEIRKSNANIE